MSYVECTYCATGLRTDAPTTVQAVCGWEIPRSAGGLNQLVNRTPLATFAHLGCVKAEVEGAPVAAAQLELDRWVKLPGGGR